METLLTWVEKCIYANLPCSHESTDLLQISSSNNILEDDVIWEVHGSLHRCHRYHGCRIFPWLCTLCWAVPWAFGVWRSVCRCGFVSGRVMWRGVKRTAVLWRGVLRHWGICWCVMWRGVIGRSVVCWCVLWTACVCWHRYMVAVLHPCSACSSVSSDMLRSGGQKWKILGIGQQSTERAVSSSSESFFLSSSRTILWLSSRNSSCWTKITRPLIKSFALLH